MEWDPEAEGRYQRRLAQPDDVQVAAIRAHTWTSHKVPLATGVYTLDQPEVPPIAADGRTAIIRQTLPLLCGRRSFAGLRLLDLGCLEGGLALEMARHGMEVVGVEGRRENYEKCALLKHYFGLPNLRFLHLDVRQLAPDTHGRFDVVLCCGLLYHLEDPFGFLALLHRLTHRGSVLFVDTHVAPPSDDDLAACRLREQLSALVTLAVGEHTYEGRWSQEFRTTHGTDEPWDAIANPRSFWPTYPSLQRALAYSGFDYLVDVLGAFNIDIELGLRREYSRIYCAALRRHN